MDITFARVVHVLSIVLWFGGVAFVTTVLFPGDPENHRSRGEASGLPSL
jgi:uncharacterized membrane protein